MSDSAIFQILFCSTRLFGSFSPEVCFGPGDKRLDFENNPDYDPDP